MLTGEVMPVEKWVYAASNEETEEEEEEEVIHRPNVLLAGSSVAAGEGVALVVSTGDRVPSFFLSPATEHAKSDGYPRQTPTSRPSRRSCKVAVPSTLSRSAFVASRTSYLASWRS